MNRYQRGLLERIGEYVVLVMVCWGILGPLVTFEALLCARDDSQLRNAGNHPTATEAISPLLVLLGWITLVTTMVFADAKTAFQVNRLLL